MDGMKYDLDKVRKLHVGAVVHLLDEDDKNSVVGIGHVLGFSRQGGCYPRADRLMVDIRVVSTTLDAPGWATGRRSSGSEVPVDMSVAIKLVAPV